MRFIREYTVDEYQRFRNLYPERETVLSEFVSKWSTESIMDKIIDNDDYIISITIPNDYDEGFACVGRKVADYFELLEFIWF